MAIEEEVANTKRLCREAGETDREKIADMFQERGDKRLVVIALELYDKYGFTNETRHAAIRKYRKDPDFEALYAEMRQHQSERFAAATATLES